MPASHDVNAQRLARIQALWRELSHANEGTPEYEVLTACIRAEADAFAKAIPKASPKQSDPKA